MNKIFILIVCFSSFALNAETDMKFTEVLYKETSPGVDPYLYRLLVNDEYIRFDAGIDQDGYILYDRKQNKIVSINHDDQTRFYIEPNSKVVKVKEIDLKIHSKAFKKAPKINNIKAKSHDLVVNENLCRQVISFSGLLSEVTLAWSKYEDLLQQQNINSLDRTPKQFQTDCFMANNITHASTFLNYGLPFSIRSKDGASKVLLNFGEITKPKSIVNIPLNYREFRL